MNVLAILKDFTFRCMSDRPMTWCSVLKNIDGSEGLRL